MGDSIEDTIVSRWLQQRQNRPNEECKTADTNLEHVSVTQVALSKNSGNDGMLASGSDDARVVIMEILAKMQRGQNLFKQAEERLAKILGDAEGEWPRYVSGGSFSRSLSEPGSSPAWRAGSSPGWRAGKRLASEIATVQTVAEEADAKSTKTDEDQPKEEDSASEQTEINEDLDSRQEQGKKTDDEKTDDDELWHRSRNKRSKEGKLTTRSFRTRITEDESMAMSLTTLSAQDLVRKLLESASFQGVSVSLILFTVVLICIDTNSRAEGVPTREWVEMSLCFCFVAYVLEFVAMLYVQRKASLKSFWTFLDTFVILTSSLDYVITLAGSEGFALLRLLRICRLLRLGRLVRVIRRLQAMRALKEQYLLIMMLASCVRTVCWAFILCMFIMTIWSILAVELLNDITVRLSETTSIWSECNRCHRSFHSIWDSNLTFMQTIIAGDSWGMVAIPVIEDSWWSLFIFLGALCTVIFGVLNMISVVVIDTFAERRSKDLTHVANELEYEEIQERKKLHKIFEKIDEDKSGELDLPELVEGSKKVREFQQYLRVLDIDGNDLIELFSMLDGDGSGTIDPEEFIDALYRMKTTESKTATRFVKHMVANLFDKSKLLHERLDTIQSSVTGKIDDVERRIRIELEDRGPNADRTERFEYILEDYAEEINNTVKEAIDKAVSATFDSVVGSAAKKASDAIHEVVVSSSNQVAKMNDRLGLGQANSRQVSAASSSSQPSMQPMATLPRSLPMTFHVNLDLHRENSKISKTEFASLVSLGEPSSFPLGA